MTTGTVKFYNSARGYGFIQPDDDGKDVFVHVTALERAGMRDLVEGQKVSFDIEADRRTGKTDWPIPEVARYHLACRKDARGFVVSRRCSAKAVASRNI